MRPDINLNFKEPPEGVKTKENSTHMRPFTYRHVQFSGLAFIKSECHQSRSEKNRKKLKNNRCSSSNDFYKETDKVITLIV